MNGIRNFVGLIIAAVGGILLAIGSSICADKGRLTIGRCLFDAVEKSGLTLRDLE